MIFFWEDITKKYVTYPNAPRTTRNGKIITSLSAFIAIMLAFILGAPLILKLLEVMQGRSKMNTFTVLWFAGTILVFIAISRIRKWTNRRLDSQAQREAAENANLTPEEYALKVQEVAKQSKRFEGWSLLAITAAFMGVFLYVLPLKTVDIRTISGGELKYNTMYYVDELLVLDGYAAITSDNGQNEQNEQRYYLAVFADKKGINWFISFFPPKNSKAALLLNDNNSWPMRLSAYVMTESLPSTSINGVLWDDDSKSWYVPSIQWYYEKARKMYATFASDSSSMNAKYVCAADENALWNTLKADNGIGLLVLLLPLSAFVSGLYMLIKYRA